MPASTSDNRLACSPLQLAACLIPSHADVSPACKLVTSTEDFESAAKASNRSVAGRGRRKALADLAGNDSPIVGLIPGLLNCAARTPCSELKSVLGAQNCTKKPLIPPREDSSNTPIGESLLRSQVKLLLQNVESDAPPIHKQAPSLRALCHLHTFVESPALKLVAPTPVNTPSSNIPSFVEQVPLPANLVVSKLFNSAETESYVEDVTRVQPSGQEEEHRADVALKVQESGIKLLVDLHISPEVEAIAPFDCLTLHSRTSEGGHITITESVLSGRDHHIMQVTQLISEVSDEVDLLALGKKTTRTLQFDSPDKVSATEMNMTSPDMKEGFTSSVRELEEDEASVWSVLVNVSSPDHESRDDEDDSANSSGLHLNQKKRASTSSRRGTPFPKGIFTGGDDEDDEQSDGSEAYLEEVIAEHMHSEGVDEEACSKGLPRAEGKHIRFTYDSDDETV